MLKCFKDQKIVELRGIYLGKDGQFHEQQYKYFKLKFQNWDRFIDGLDIAEKYMKSQD